MQYGMKKTAIGLFSLIRLVAAKNRKIGRKGKVVFVICYIHCQEI